MASTTREKLIDVAKQLFIRKGVENTTISDIANASDKGRRTIYTYFKNKKEIYRAVIERESDKMVEELRSVIDSEASPAEKLCRFITLRTTQNKNASSPYAAIRFLSSIDFGRTERVRRLAYEKEEAMLRSVVSDGVRCGDFDAERSRCVLQCLYTLIRATDLINTDEDSVKTEPDFGPALSQMVINSIKK